MVTGCHGIDLAIRPIVVAGVHITPESGMIQPFRYSLFLRGVSIRSCKISRKLRFGKHFTIVDCTWTNVVELNVQTMALDPLLIPRLGTYVHMLYWVTTTVS